MKAPQSFLMIMLALAIFAVSCGGDSSGDDPFKMTTYPNIEVEPSALLFSALASGGEETLVLTITNTGAGDDLELKKIYLQDEETPFSFEEPSSMIIPRGLKQTLKVTYRPTDLVNGPGVLVIESNAEKTPVLEVDLNVMSGGSGLTAFPNPMDFVDVLGGSSKTQTLTITNSGSEDVELTNIYIQPDSSSDFTLAADVGLPVILGAWDNILVSVQYTPTGQGIDSGTLIIAVKKDGGQNLLPVTLHGNEVGPEINVNKDRIDFGWVAIDDTASQDLTIFNMGQHDLIIQSLYFGTGNYPVGADDLKVSDAPVTPFTIKKGENKTISLSFTPSTFFAASSDPIGGLAIKSNDADESILIVPIYGAIDAPFIKIAPESLLDFGIVAQSWEIPRTLTIANVGHGELEITSVEIVENSGLDEFAITPDPEFPPTEGSGTAVVLPNDTDNDNSYNMELTFVNNGPDTGIQMGKLKIVSNDPVTPELYVDLKANRGGSPFCEIAFAPGKVEFGIVAHGGQRTMAINVINSGSGYCSWSSARVSGCDSFFGMMTTCQANAGMSTFFMPTGPMPFPIQDGIAPGTAKPIQILYTPPTDIPMIPLFEEYFGVFQVNYTEPYSVPGVYTAHTYPEPEYGGTIQWNLHGTSGVADIAVLPSELDFGLVTIGCLSQVMVLKVYNAGTAPLDVTDLYLDGCGPEFQVMDYPELPVTVGPSEYKEVKVVYLPQNEGVDKCNLVFESTDQDTPLYYVPLQGEGTFDTEQTDIFTQIDGKKVDLLFVIDDSGSMSNEQDNLKNNFQFLTDVAAAWNNDYQIGIVTVDITDEETVGKLVGEPRIITKTSIGAFDDNVTSIGSGGAGTQESGLEAGRRALTPPLARDSEIACSCAQDQPCPGTCMEPDICVSGGCGGFNRGLIRKDAALEIIFVSDEEDQSPGSVPFYIDFYKSLKGFMNTGLFHAHAIVGDKNGGCGGGASESGADAGKRYIEVQEATGGVFGSICDTSFADVLEDIGNQAFGLQVQFFLSAQADPTPGSIRVWVDSGSGWAECNNGWSFDPASNAVVFDEAGTCMPQANDKIKIWYQMVCNTL